MVSYCVWRWLIIQLQKSFDENEGWQNRIVGTFVTEVINGQCQSKVLVVVAWLARTCWFVVMLTKMGEYGDICMILGMFILYLQIVSTTFFLWCIISYWTRNPIITFSMVYLEITIDDKLIISVSWFLFCCSVLQ